MIGAITEEIRPSGAKKKLHQDNALQKVAKKVRYVEVAVNQLAAA